MMSIEAMQAFRQRYRAEVKPGYSGWRHMLSVAAVGIAAIAYALSTTDNITAIEWLTIPVTLLVVNFAEYYAHRWLGHRKTKIGKLFYKRHTGDHHSFFLESHMKYESSRDWRVVLFPLYLIFAFIIGFALPGYFLLNWLIGPNVAALYVAGTLGGYLFYEVMHFSFHIPEGAWEEKLFLYIPGWRFMRESHRLHHRRDSMAESNFNITLPIFDILFRTLQMQ